MCLTLLLQICCYDQSKIQEFQLKYKNRVCCSFLQVQVSKKELPCPPLNTERTQAKEFNISLSTRTQTKKLGCLPAHESYESSITNYIVYQFRGRCIVRAISSNLDCSLFLLRKFVNSMLFFNSGRWKPQEHQPKQRLIASLSGGWKPHCLQSIHTSQIHKLIDPC